MKRGWFRTASAGRQCALAALGRGLRPSPETSLAVDLSMKHSEFRIGLEFWCGGKRWRCTDVGTRVVTAISLEPREVEEVISSDDTAGPAETRRYTTDDPTWLLGPPYKIAESVFDEYDIDGCSLTPEEQG